MISKIIDGTEQNVAGNGGGGTNDYEGLTNLPQINGNDLIGNQTGTDLGLVDAEEGKGLSTNDYTNEDKAKLDIDTHTLEGNPLSFTTDSAQVAKDAVITIEPIQAGSGDPSPSNVRAISGYDKIEVLSCGKNLLPLSISEIKAANNETTWNGNSCTLPGGATLTLLGDNDKLNGIKLNGTVSSQSYIILCRPTYNDIGNILKTGVYYTCTDISISDNITQGYEGTFTIRSDWHFDNAFVYFFANAVTYDNATYYPQLEVGSIATTFETSNINEVKLTFGQTVYGGTLDLKNGILMVDRAIVDLGDYNYNKVHSGSYFRTEIDAPKYKAPQNFGMCTCYQYRKYNEGELVNNNEITITSIYYGSDNYILIRDDNYTDATTFKTAVTGQKLVYSLATPYTIQLTPHEISLLSGYNYVSTTADSIELTYSDGVLATLEDVKQVGESVNALSDVVSEIFSHKVTLTDNFVAPANGFAFVYILQNQGTSSGTNIIVNEDNVTIFSHYIWWNVGWAGATILVPLRKGHTYTFTCDTSPASVDFDNNRAYFIY